MTATFPPLGPTTLKKVIAAYLYVQYNDDPDLQAFFSAHNALVQSYVDCFNSLNLAVYINDNISGDLLDWVAQGLYGITRPILSSPGVEPLGPYASYPFGALQFAGYAPQQGGNFSAASDDYFRRILTWALYKGDGKNSSIPWLKRRIIRFLNGVDGTDFNIDQTYDISITFTGNYQGLIKVPNTTAGTTFIEAVNAGVIELPIPWIWTVQTWTPPDLGSQLDFSNPDNSDLIGH